MTWDGVLQLSVMTLGGLVKPPMVPRGVDVDTNPWDCLRGTLAALYLVAHPEGSSALARHDQIHSTTNPHSLQISNLPFPNQPDLPQSPTTPSLIQQGTSSPTLSPDQTESWILSRVIST